MTSYQIGNIAKMLGVSPRTIRYYEELELITADRSEGGFRLFSEAQVEKLKVILTLKELGLSLEEINKFVHLRRPGATGAEITPPLIEYLTNKIKEFEDKIEKYKKGLAELKNVVSVMENCTECKNPAQQKGCERCVDELTHHHVPPLMKTLL